MPELCNFRFRAIVLQKYTCIILTERLKVIPGRLEFGFQNSNQVNLASSIFLLKQLPWLPQW